MSQHSTTNILLNSGFSSQLISQLYELIFIISSDGKIHESNQELYLPKNIKHLLHQQDWDHINHVISQKLKTDLSVFTLEIELKLANKLAWFECKIGKINPSYSNHSYYYLAFQNIQALKDREEKLIEAKEKAESQEKIKTSFLANMSHEIRTPMNSIIGFTELIQNADNENDKKQYLDIIKNSGEYLLNIINDIIDISKIESGLLDIKVHRVNINDLFDELIDIYKSDIRLKPEMVNLNSIKPLHNEEALILTDQTRIRQILSNLLDNAIKFTSNGSIELGYELLNKKGSKSQFIQFYVKDTGCGIPKSQVDLIFHRFHQVREHDETKGSGLGLVIVDALVKKLGGKITVSSVKGKGSKFSFEIPYLLGKQSKKFIRKGKEEVAKPELNNRHILIAEDVSANFKFVSAILKGTHAKLTWVQNGKEAVEAVLDGGEFDLVLMDLRMPVMDGYKASGHIKTIKPNLPIIALTAFAVDGDMEKALEAGCDDYLSKPICIPDFYQKIDLYLNK